MSPEGDRSRTAGAVRHQEAPTAAVSTLPCTRGGGDLPVGAAADVDAPPSAAPVATPSAAAAGQPDAPRPAFADSRLTPPAVVASRLDLARAPVRRPAPPGPAHRRASLRLRRAVVRLMMR